MGLMSNRVIYLATSLVVLTFLFAIAAAHFEESAIVQDVNAPAFHKLELPSAGESLAAMEGHLHRPSGAQWLREMMPNQGGALWIALVVFAVAGMDGSGWSARTRDLLLIQVAGWLLFGSLDIFAQTDDPVFLGWIRIVFELVGLVTAVVWARTYWLQWRPYPRRWTPAVGQRVLIGLAMVLITLNLAVVFVDVPDDSSFFANLGGQRLRERGHLPYGDPMLTGTPGAAYPPLLYLLHAGVQAAIAAPLPTMVQEQPVLGGRSEYREPPRVATQLVIGLSHLIGLGALWVLGYRNIGEAGAWALVSLYAGSSYLLDFGGSRASVGGLTFVSHIVPASATLAAFAVLERPIVSGALLAASAGLGFYPVFFYPVWAAWQWRRSPSAAAWFTAAFAIFCSAIGVWVLAWSTPAPGMGLVATIVRDTLGHHSDPNGYGLSIYGLWGQQTGVLGWLGHPSVGSAAWSTPFFVLFAASLLVAAWLALRADIARLALLTAGAAIGANLWKIHATATYVSWYYPLLLLGLLAVSAVPRSNAATEPASV
jgi:hypothetical protein